MSARSVIGVLLAAGKSSRMGRPKQLIGVPTAAGRQPMVAAAFDSIAGVCERVIVVVGFERERVVEALGERRFEVAESSADAEMVESVRVAFRACVPVRRGSAKVAESVDGSLVSHHQSQELGLSGDCATFVKRKATLLLQLADHPRVESETLEQLLAASVEFPNHVIIPRFQGRGGHPILIPADVARDLIDRPLGGGLRAFWEANLELCHYVEVDDDGVTMDLDTPGDLQKAKIPMNESEI